jgi:hypothetical protein
MKCESWTFRRSKAVCCARRWVASLPCNPYRGFVPRVMKTQKMPLWQRRRIATRSDRYLIDMKREIEDVPRTREVERIWRSCAITGDACSLHKYLHAEMGMSRARMSPFLSCACDSGRHRVGVLAARRRKHVAAISDN